jgi:hypothetical protein
MARRSQSQIRAQRNLRIMFAVLAILVVGSMIISAIGPTVNISSGLPTSAPIRTAVPLPFVTP